MREQYHLKDIKLLITDYERRNQDMIQRLENKTSKETFRIKKHNMVGHLFPGLTDLCMETVQGQQSLTYNSINLFQKYKAYNIM